MAWHRPITIAPLLVSSPVETMKTLFCDDAGCTPSQISLIKTLVFRDATLVLGQWATLDATVSLPDLQRFSLYCPRRTSVSFDPVGRDFIGMLLEAGERSGSTVAAEEEVFFAREQRGGPVSIGSVVAWHCPITPLQSLGSHDTISDQEKDITKQQIEHFTTSFEPQGRSARCWKRARYRRSARYPIICL